MNGKYNFNDTGFLDFLELVKRKKKGHHCSHHDEKECECKGDLLHLVPDSILIIADICPKCNKKGSELIAAFPGIPLLFKAENFSKPACEKLIRNEIPPVVLAETLNVGGTGKVFTVEESFNASFALTLAESVSTGNNDAYIFHLQWIDNQGNINTILIAITGLPDNLLHVRDCHGHYSTDIGGNGTQAVTSIPFTAVSKMIRTVNGVVIETLIP